MDDDKVKPIEVNPLFSVLSEKLTGLLKSLKQDGWERHTIARLWSVKDVAAHLLDGDLRALSLQRDGHQMASSPKTRNYKDVVKWLNAINAEWVNTAVRLSPEVIIMLLEQTNEPVAEYFSSLPPFEKSVFPVDWAGEQESKNWLHVAREYTERWIHQQQIRNAVKQEDELMTKELFYPFIDTLMYGLPYRYAKTKAKEGTVAKVTVSSEIGGSWAVTKTTDNWQLTKADNKLVADAEVIISPDTAWKLFTKAIKPETAKLRAEIKGNEKLADVALGMLSVMA
jgi:hypothetical protein